jgi:lysozyme
MQISSKGLALIKKFEGLSLVVYDDVGHPAIGYGHDLLSDETYPYGIDIDFAVKLLLRDVSKAANAVEALVTIPLTQPQFDALVSFTFNVGVHHFSTSTLLKLLNTKDFASAEQQFYHWIFVTKGTKKIISPQLQQRRIEEAALFRSLEVV